MTDVLKVEQHQQPGQPLPEVEFALIISRTIDALKNDPALLRSSVYELARTTLSKDLSDGDPGQTQRLAQALESAIRGVEDFAVRQEGAIGLGGSITGPMNELSQTARLIAPAHPSGDIYSPSGTRAAPPAVIQIDHPAFETRVIRNTFARGAASVRDQPAKGNGSLWRAVQFALGVALLVVLIGVIIEDRSATRSVVTSKPVNSAPQSAPVQPATAPAASDPVTTDPAAAAAPPAAATVAPVATPIPGLPLPTSYGNYVVRNGQLAELELLEGQVPDKRVAVSSPIHTASRTILPDGSPTFVIFRRDLANIPTDNIEARVVARIRRTMKFDTQQPTYTSEDLWSIRPFAYKFRSAPVPGNPEMMLIKPEGTALPPGRYALVLKRQGYDFTVAGKITDPNQCLERTEAANGSFYSPCRP